MAKRDLCQVCGDNSNVGNYRGVDLCGGCRSFHWRRSSLGSRSNHMPWACLRGTNNCSVHIGNRNECEYCRFAKIEEQLDKWTCEVCHNARRVHRDIKTCHYCFKVLEKMKTSTTTRLRELQCVRSTKDCSLNHKGQRFCAYCFSRRFKALGLIGRHRKEKNLTNKTTIGQHGGQVVLRPELFLEVRREANSSSSSASSREPRVYEHDDDHREINHSHNDNHNQWACKVCGSSKQDVRYRNQDNCYNCYQFLKRRERKGCQQKCVTKQGNCKILANDRYMVCQYCRLKKMNSLGLIGADSPLYSIFNEQGQQVGSPSKKCPVCSGDYEGFTLICSTCQSFLERLIRAVEPHYRGCISREGACRATQSICNYCRQNKLKSLGLLFQPNNNMASNV